MKPKVIKTERDYNAALAHIEALMDMASPDEAELELWSLLVEKYEEEHFPIAAPDSSKVPARVRSYPDTH